MTYEEALDTIARAVAPESLSTLQIDVFRSSWHKQSYYKIAANLNHEYSYIKDVGAELWKLLSQALGIQVTKLNLHDALAQYVRQQTRNLSASSSQRNQRVDWGEAPDTTQFCGRKEQLETLEQWAIQDRCRTIAIVGMGGIGKTMLVTHLAQQLADTDLFEVVVWRSLRQVPPLIDLLAELICAIAPEQSLPLRLDAMMRQLLEQLRHHRCLLILDNVEAVLCGGQLVGTYVPGYEDYGWLFQQLGEGQHQSTVLLTSREIPAEVAIQQGLSAPTRLLRLEPLLSDEGEKILATKGLTFQPLEQPQVQELIKRYQGNPRALEMVATPLKELFNSNIAAFLAQEALLFKDLRELLAQQFNRLSSLERQVMYWLAINREPVTAAQLQTDLIPSISHVELRDALLSLDRRSLIEKITLITSAQPITLMSLDCVGYTQQPVVMEYFTEELVERVCQEVKQAQIVYLRNYTLLKAQATDRVRELQMRLIVQPILARLLEIQGGNENLKQLLLQLLQVEQSQAPLQPGYFAKNAVHLLRQLGADLSHLNFTNALTWQADLRMVKHGTNCCHADLSHSMLIQSISDILCVTFSPDAKHIATSHDNGEVCVWRVEDGQQSATFKGIAASINSLAFSPESETLIISNADQIVKLHIPSGKVRGELHGHTGAVLSVALSADGRFLASGGEDSTIKIWDMQSLKCLKILEGHQGWVSALAFAPAPHLAKSDLLASGGSDLIIRLWEVRSGQTLHILEGHTKGLLAVAFSPDGLLLASSSVDRTIRLWDTQTGQAIAVWRHDTAAWTLAFSPDGQTLASGNEDHTIKLWNVETGQCYLTLLGHPAVVQSMAFSPNGLSLASAALNQSICLWDVQVGQCLKTWQGYSKEVVSCVVDLEGRTFASHGDTLRLWDVRTGDCLMPGYSDRISSLEFSPRKQCLASGNNECSAKLRDVCNSQRLLTLEGHTRQRQAIASDPAQSLASGSDDPVKLWVQTGQCFETLQGHTSPIRSVAFDPEGRMLVSSSEDGTIRLWDSCKGRMFESVEECRSPLGRSEHLRLNGRTKRRRCEYWGQ